MKIKGTVGKVFHEKDNGFKIITVDLAREQTIPEEYRNPDFPMSLSAVGTMRDAQEGYVVELNGEWDHRENGRYWPWQFKVKNCTVCTFETPALLIKVIAGINGFGRTRAKRLVEAYGTKIVAILEKDPRRICSDKSISAAEADALSVEFKRIHAAADLKAYLVKYGVSDSDIEKVQERYGSSALSVIRGNPYQLCNDRILPFRLSDKIAKDNKGTFDDPRRVEALMGFVLVERAGGKGHTYLTKSQLVDDINAFSKDNAEIAGSLNRRMTDEFVARFVGEKKLILEGDRVYSKQRYESEKTVADILRKRSALKSIFADVDQKVLEECIAEMEKEQGVTLDILQRQAVIMAITSQTSILTGGPGCGKTTTLKTVIGAVEKLVKRMKLRPRVISLAAPTGMAAKRMVESTDREARTIHKLLDYNPAFLLQVRCEDNPIDADFVILDETSMVDIDVAAMMLKAVKDETQMLFLGDINQLPSIGPGEVLSDMICSELFPVIELKRSFRHGSRKTILENANRIIAGDDKLDMKHSDFLFYEVPDRSADRECERLLATLKRVYFEEYAAIGRNAEKIQVLTPMKQKTLVSVDKVNPALQDMVNALVDGDDQLRVGSVCFRKNDRVMQISNNYDKNVYNGDMGIVVMVSSKTGKVLVDYGGTLVEYTRHEIDQLKHCFAITIHKSQGNEFPIVIIPITNFHSVLLMRNLLYTAVTRAKQKLILVGDKEAIGYAIRNVQGTKRNTGLLEKMTEDRKIAA